VLRHQPAEPAAECQPADAGGRDRAAGRRETVQRGRAVEVGPERAAVRAGGLRRRVDVDASHRRQVDHQRVVLDGAAGDVVAAAANRDVETRSAREVHGVDDVCCVGAAGDRRGAAVDHRVVNRASGLVAVVGGREDGAGKVDAELFEPGRRVCRRRQRVPPLGVGLSGESRRPFARVGFAVQVDRTELQALQAPLKEQYRAEPGSAVVTLRAEGTLGQESVTCSVATGRALVEAGLHPATGGTGLQACSGDMLLEALVACAGVTLRAVATSLEIPVSGTLRAEGDLDFRGTLGVDREAPVGFTAIRLTFDLQHDASEEQLERLLRLTERYCVVFQTLTAGVQVDVTF
jgi:uncharacterized OsmC-like protein